jgi:hypothetical protein
MSTPGNSETYIVCKGFKGVDEQYKRKLLHFTGKVYILFISAIQFLFTVDI